MKRSHQKDVGSESADPVELRLVFFCFDSNEGINVAEITEYIDSTAIILGGIKKSDALVGTHGGIFFDIKLEREAYGKPGTVINTRTAENRKICIDGTVEALHIIADDIIGLRHQTSAGQRYCIFIGNPQRNLGRVGYKIDVYE